MRMTDGSVEAVGGMIKNFSQSETNGNEDELVAGKDRTA